MPSYVLAAPDDGEVTDAVLAALRADTTTPWGDAEAPGGNDDQAPPYGIVYNIATGATNDATEGTLPDATKLIIYQIVSFGQTRQQADHLAHTARRTFTDKNINGTPGWRVPIEGEHHRVIDRRANASSGTRKEGRWFRSETRYQLMVTILGDQARF